MRVALLLVGLLGCHHTNGAKADAKIDGKMIDAPIDALIDAPPPPTGHYYYIFDHEIVPATNSQARMYGLDLDNDGTVDNQLGMVFGSLVQNGLDTPTATQHAIDIGTISALADLYTTDFTTASAPTLAAYVGANPMPAACAGAGDTTCRHQLAGTGSFQIPSTGPTNPALTGAATAGTFALGPGHLAIQLAFTPATAFELDLIGAQVRLSTVNGTTIGSGILAGGITMTTINGKLLPAAQAAMAVIVDRDCCGPGNQNGHTDCTGGAQATPTCYCTNGSNGGNLIGIFDTSPKDCSISLAELQNNSLLMSLLAPDVTLEGQQALSLGIGVTAVQAGFAPP